MKCSGQVSALTPLFPTSFHLTESLPSMALSVSSVSLKVHATREGMDVRLGDCDCGSQMSERFLRSGVNVIVLGKLSHLHLK